MSIKLLEPVTIAEAAKYLGIPESAIRQGLQGTASLTRIRQGKGFVLLLQELSALKRSKASVKQVKTGARVRSLRDKLSSDAPTRMTRG